MTAYLLSSSGVQDHGRRAASICGTTHSGAAAGEIDLREFLVEARPLRGDDVLLPAAVRDALFDRLPTVPAITGRNGPLGTLCEMFTITQIISGIMFTIVVLDEQVILFNCINGHLGAFAYSRYAVEDALQTGEVLLPISTGSIMMTKRTTTSKSRILTYASSTSRR